MGHDSRGLESGKRRLFPYSSIAQSIVDKRNCHRCITVSLAGIGKGVGDALRDCSLVDNEASANLINTQNHKNNEVRELVGLLLRHNIHWVAPLIKS